MRRIDDNEQRGLAGRLRAPADVHAIPRAGCAGRAAGQHAGVHIADRQLHAAAGRAAARPEAHLGQHDGGRGAGDRRDQEEADAEAAITPGDAADHGGGADLRPAAQPGEAAAVAEPRALRARVAGRPDRAAGHALERSAVRGDVGDDPEARLAARDP
eukprot:335694-Hanusia_phi.AAC.11